MTNATPSDRDILATPRRPFEDLPSHLLGSLLSDVPASTAATVLANLPEDHARWLFAELPAVTADGIVRCWAAGDLLTTPDAIREAEAALETRLRERPLRPAATGGPDLAAHLLCLLPRPERDDRLKALARTDPQVASAVRDRILEFEDLAQLTVDDMQRLLDRVEPADLADAIRGESQLVQGAFVDRLGATRAMVVKRLLAEDARHDRGSWARRRILEVAAGMIDDGRIGWPMPVGA
jgi:flagellar motor switch protein FliG